MIATGLVVCLVTGYLAESTFPDNVVLYLPGLILYVIGWLILVMWFFNGRTGRPSLSLQGIFHGLRHIVRITPWFAGAIFFTVAAGKLESSLSAGSILQFPASVGLLIGFGCWFAALGWFDWHWSSSHYAGPGDYDDALDDSDDSDGGMDGYRDYSD